jgi:hypothetical protein
MNNFSIDTGSNISSIAYLWLGLHYLLPYIIGFILLAIAAITGIYLYNKVKGSDLTYDQILMGLVGAGLIIIIILFR